VAGSDWQVAEIVVNVASSACRLMSSSLPASSDGTGAVCRIPKTTMYVDTPPLAGAVTFLKLLFHLGSFLARINIFAAT
jgi:hypothetical protein